MKTYITLIVAVALLTASCKQKKVDASKADNISTAVKQEVQLPAPYQTKAVSNYCKVIGWPAGKMPTAPEGFKVNLFADTLKNPRNIYIAPNGDIFVSEANTEVKGIKKIGAKIIGVAASQNLGKSANRITIFTRYQWRRYP